MGLDRFVLLALATFAITYLIRYFDGPFGVLLKFRMACGLEYLPVLGSDGEQVGIVESTPNYDDKLARFISCHWCVTTWVSLVVMLLNVGFTLDLMYYWLAGVAVSGILHNLITGG